MLGTAHGVHAGVVRQRAHALRYEPGRHLLDFAPRQAIDDASVARVLIADKLEQLHPGVDLIDDRIADIRPVETRHEYPRIIEPEARDNLRACLRVGRGREGDPRYLGETLVQERELEILRSKIVAPLRDAVRFIDCE